MDNEEDGFCNPGSLKRRLRLRKDFKERYYHIYVYIKLC